MSQTPHPSEPQNVTGHLIAHAGHDVPAVISVRPAGATESDEGRQGQQQQHMHERYEPVNQERDRLPCVYPADPTPFNDRCPLPYEPQGYVHISPRDTQDWKGARDKAFEQEMKPAAEDAWEREEEEILLAEQEPPQLPSDTDFVTSEAFQKIVEGFKGGDGKFLAMTAYGAVPLPDQMLQTIPEKFVTKPLVQEREVFVLKQDHQVRVTERDYTQFDHKFVPVSKTLVVDKIQPVDDVKVIEIPHFKYIPVVEEKVVDIPYGIKYVEVPIEVKCRMPPRIVPVPKPHIVERIIETTKPVVQEKIIEVPEIIKKKVPRVVTKEIPYVVAKYVEKIVEVPYKSGQELPAPQGRPMTVIPKPPALPPTGAGGGQPIPPPGAQRPLEPQRPGGPVAPAPPTFPAAPGRVEGATLVVEEKPKNVEPQTFYLAQGIQHIKLPYEARIDVSVVQENEIPPGAAIAQRGVRYMAPGSRAVAYGEAQKADGASRKVDEPVYAGSMDPIIEHAAPGMRAIEFRTRSEEPDILTQQGVLKYSKFECCLKKDATKLLPNLPHHDLVPMEPEGTPSLKGLTFIHSQHAARMGKGLAAHTKS